MLHRKIGWMLLCSAVLLASCNDDETNGNGGNGPAVPPAEVTADVDYEVFGGEDMPQLFDMQAKYTDAVGKTVTADVASLPWSISVKGAKVPFEATVELVLTAKEELRNKPPTAWDSARAFPIQLPTANIRRRPVPRR